MVNGQTKIRDWYKDAYPTDEWAIDSLNRLATFQDAFECLSVGFNFYTFLGVSDSLVRERVFEQLSELMGCEYGYICDRWLNHAEQPLGYLVITNMKRMKF